MNLRRFQVTRCALILVLILLASASVSAQEKAKVLTAAETARVAPASFYFEGQSAPTQMRNTAVARLGEKRHFIAGLVDTSGYSTDIRAKYEGFLIADSPVSIGGRALATGAYGFGFTNDGKLNVFDIGGNPVLTVTTATDRALRRPRPLMMMNAADGLRLYAGRSYVTVSFR